LPPSRVTIHAVAAAEAKAWHGGDPAARARGAKVQFFGEKQSADDVIYLIDRSESMAAGGVFDRVARETLVSIAEAAGGKLIKVKGDD